METFTLGVVLFTLIVLALVIFVEIFINQELLMAYEVASKSSEIVQQLFPPQVRERLFAGNKKQLRTFLSSEADSDNGKTTRMSDEDFLDLMLTDEGSKPIADLFPGELLEE